MNDIALGAAALWFDDDQMSILPFGDGHIHDSYLVTSRTQEYVLQRMNEHVFVDPKLVMSQIGRLLAVLGDTSDYALPQIQLSKNGASYERFAEGAWRIWNRLPGVTLNVVGAPDQAYMAARAFAQLQVNAAHLEPRLQPTINHFLRLPHYLRTLEAELHKASDEHKALVDRYAHLAELLQDDNAHIHGDCKLDNLLFADRSAGATVVGMLDFDTAMWGNRAWDFGDLVRSLSTSGRGFSAEIFQSAYGGFCEGGITLSEHEALQAPSYVAFMLGVRFLHDHLVGDVYFKVKRPGENLERANVQFSLLETMSAMASEMRKAVATVGRTF